MAEDKGLILKGDLRMATVDGNGNVTGGWSDTINVPKLQITQPTVNTVRRMSRQRDTNGQALDIVNIPNEPAKVEIQFDSLPASLLAEALAGTSTSYTIASGSAADEAVTLVQDQWVQLAHQNLTADSVIVTETAGSSELTEGTDYQVDYDWGMIKALNSTGAVAVTVDYDYAASTGMRVLGATEIDKPRRLMLKGTNLATNRAVTATIYFARLSATEATDLMKQDFITGTLSGELVTPANQAAPFVIDMAD